MPTTAGSSTSSVGATGPFVQNLDLPTDPIDPIDCGDYMCEAKPGYDGPTGWGTPNGIGAF